MENERLDCHRTRFVKTQQCWLFFSVCVHAVAVKLSLYEITVSVWFECNSITKWRQSFCLKVHSQFTWQQLSYDIIVRINATSSSLQTSNRTRIEVIIYMSAKKQKLFRWPKHMTGEFLKILVRGILVAKASDFALYQKLNLMTTIFFWNSDRKYSRKSKCAPSRYDKSGCGVFKKYKIRKIFA